MKLCRFLDPQNRVHVGVLSDDDKVLDLAAAEVTSITTLLEAADPLKRLAEIARSPLPRLDLSEVRLISPVERQEVWAVGVTYLRSKSARMEESVFSASAYDRVYDAERPELFFKALPEKVIGPGDSVGIRGDAAWSVPEPELALVLNSRGTLVGFTIGNDMSSRDIEGENLLYLPQAKVYDRSCAVGPCILIGRTEAEARQWAIHLQIRRAGEEVFSGTTSVGQIKRSFDELRQFTCRSQTFPHGVVLLTGTGIVPADDFTLEAGDTVRITIDGIGTLENPVVRV
jgi:2-dehydro-3-deoxy-D-arabinonate dehydratase